MTPTNNLYGNSTRIASGNMTLLPNIPYMVKIPMEKSLTPEELRERIRTKKKELKLTWLQLGGGDKKRAEAIRNFLRGHSNSLDFHIHDEIKPVLEGNTGSANIIVGRGKAKATYKESQLNDNKDPERTIKELMWAFMRETPPDQYIIQVTDKLIERAKRWGVTSPDISWIKENYPLARSEVINLKEQL